MASEPAPGKLFAGGRLRRLRLRLGLTQARMAEDLALSPSYLNLLERNQRPLTAAVLLRLAEAYDVDIRELTGADTDRQAADLVRLLERVAPAPVGRAEARDFADSHPAIAEAVLKLGERLRDAAAPQPAPPSPLAAVRAHLLERANHFPALESHAEELADSLRLSGLSLDAAIRERLRARHGLVVRLLPLDVMPDRLRRLDLHARQVHLSEALDGASRTFQLAVQLADLEARALIDAEVEAARGSLAPAGPVAERLLRLNLANYWAGALMMPYARFHAAAEQLGYDLELLQARFSAGFEQVAHRLTTLQRPGARGIPFMMIRADRAGQISKRLSAAPLPFARDGGRCPLWVLYEAFAQPGRILTQVAEDEDGTRIFTIARTVRPQVTPWGAERPSFAIALSCALDHAGALVYAAGTDLAAQRAVPVGPSCNACLRRQCRQRAAPPDGAVLRLDPLGRGLTPYEF
ncbi:helix-turn-helix domain-containing protein [Thermaurantiacus tibetensis]|uniref:helix-turn-helix domain-containing protein n=1 Tax=Thermaurantiacus tibetensis TaxID=2759035 RepID=UPI002E2CA5B4|nr:short-chain fatty acyl-CoA regulator family protein [Thermaurantiacus tibetensis]